jgi:predicted metal-dependent phosphoesterase TrpH
MDGELSVTDILDKCEKNGMELVSINDHNSVKGVYEALQYKGKFRYITGVELDCYYRGVILHLLGYGIDHTLAEFAEIENDIINQEKSAGLLRVRLFRDFSGIPIDQDAVAAFSKNGWITGELIMEYLLAQKNALEYEILKPYMPGEKKGDMPYVHFYWDFFAAGKPADVPINVISLEDGIKLIHKAGGIAVLAHPKQNLTGKYDLLNDIISEGIDGIEVFSSYHSPEDAGYFLDIAKQNRLFFSCGSDFHGKSKPLIGIGDHGSTVDDREISGELFSRLGFLA